MSKPFCRFLAKSCGARRLAREQGAGRCPRDNRPALHGFGPHNWNGRCPARYSTPRPVHHEVQLPASCSAAPDDALSTPLARNHRQTLNHIGQERTVDYATAATAV